jgi:hypothetical protein
VSTSATEHHAEQAARDRAAREGVRAAGFIEALFHLPTGGTKIGSDVGAEKLIE